MYGKDVRSLVLTQRNHSIVHSSIIRDSHSIVHHSRLPMDLIVGEAHLRAPRWPLEVLQYTRAPKTCRICGHFKHIGHYKYKHTYRECKVDNTDKCIQRYKGYCSCEHGTETAELSGIPNALKTIRKVYS